MLYYFFKSVPTPESSTTTFTFRHFRQFSFHDWFAGGASATSVAPPPPRSLSLSGVRGVFVLVEHHFPRCCCFFFECVLSARLDDVCGFSTESRRVDNGHYCLLSSSLATAGRSTKWNSFAILGRAHVHTHYLDVVVVAALDYKNGKSHSPESNWNGLPRGHTTTHTNGKITLHTEN